MTDLNVIVHVFHDYNLASILIFAVLELWLKSKFPYAIWFEAGSKLVADTFETGLQPASNLPNMLR